MCLVLLSNYVHYYLFKFQVELDDLEDIDIESDDFKSLPPEIQHEILTDLKEARKWTCYLKKENLPKVNLILLISVIMSDLVNFNYLP